MSKKIIFALVGIIFFSSFHLARAETVINEIMYDLDGSDIDWVEVCNSGSDDIDLTTLNILISNSTSNHGINKYSGSQILHSGDYGVIVSGSDISAFINKWGNSGNIFTSSFTLPNSGGKIEINNNDKLSPLSSVSYNPSQGAAGDGNSLQLIAGSWKSSISTSGISNGVASNNVNRNTNSSSAINTGAITVADTISQTTTSKKTENPKIRTKITVKDLAFAGLPVDFKDSATGYSGELLGYGKYFWNFGDGDSKETKETEKFTHTYFYPGEYSVTLEYFTNEYSQNPDATDKIIIKVVPMEVSISKVGDNQDSFVELANNSEHEIDISKWVLSANGKQFIFPRNSVIMTKKMITISGRLTKFTDSDIQNLKLNTFTGILVSDYNAPIAVQKNIQPVTITPTQIIPEKSVTAVEPTPVKVVKIATENTSIETGIKKPVAIIIEPKDLSATVVNNNAVSLSTNRSFLPVISFIVLLGASGSAVYFIRRRKVIPEIGSDFDILDE